MSPMSATSAKGHARRSIWLNLSTTQEERRIYLLNVHANSRRCQPAASRLQQQLGPTQLVRRTETKACNRY